MVFYFTNIHIHLCTYSISWAGKLASTICEGTLHTAPIRIFCIPYLPFMLHVMGPRAWRGDQTTGAKVGSPFLPLPPSLTLGSAGYGEGGPDLRGGDGRQTFSLDFPLLNQPLVTQKIKNKNNYFHLSVSVERSNSVSC